MITHRRPTAPASSPWSRACCPSVAETVLWLSRASLTGRAPVCRMVARSWAELMSKLPEIWAPVRPSIPSGFSTKLMIGFEKTWLSSTIAKCCEFCSAGRRAERARRRGRVAPLGDRPGDVLERRSPAVGEVEGDVGLVGGRVEVLLRVLDLGPVQRRAIGEHELRRVGYLRRRQGQGRVGRRRRDQGALRDGEDLRCPGGCFVVPGVEEEVVLPLGRAAPAACATSCRTGSRWARSSCICCRCTRAFASRRT